MQQLRIHYLQHVPYEGLGCIASWVAENGHKLSSTKFYEEEHELPDVASLDWLIVLGGPMGVYDEDVCRWLKEEKAFIKGCVDEGKKVLCICLGAQLAAESLGARVVKATSKEIGWFPVYPTANCEHVSWLYQLLGNKPVVFHWHGDQFGIPTGALGLATSEANVNQAFLYNNQVLGLQFHLEVTTASLRDMVENGRSELLPDKYIQTAAEILHAHRPLQTNNRMMYALLDNSFAK
jgi:GMP synthase-like glutamine amidotransferase